MTAENFTLTMRAFLDRIPFRAFTIELHTGRKLEIDNSVNVIIDAPVIDVLNGPNR